jgi:polyisoprenoid-binding protein YceI
MKVKCVSEEVVIDVELVCTYRKKDRQCVNVNNTLLRRHGFGRRY